MNERIRLLALEAGEHVNSVYTPPVRSKTPGKIWEDGHIGWHTQFNQKFAELIVGECVKVAVFKDSGLVATADVAGHMAAGRSIAAQMINEHFGVEETSIKIGSRVKVISGFNVGAKGTVSYIEPLGKMWVMRDGASTDVFYHPEEVVRIEE